MKTALVLYFLFCITVLGLRYVVLPNIASYKPQVEQMVSRALGNRVAIDRIAASWSGLHPRLSLDRMVIYDKDDRPALTLPHVSATLSWWSVVVRGLSLYQLEVDRPDMDIRRDADGRLYVAGIYIDTHKKGDPSGMDWLLSQREIVIRDGRLRWIDEKRGAPELVLEDVGLVLRNRWRRHRFGLKATPPASHSAPLDIRADFMHPPFAENVSDAGTWKGEVYLALQDTDLAVWKAYVDYPLDLWQGKGSLRAWLKFERSKVANFTADLSLANVGARLRKDLDPLNLVAVSGRISVREEITPDSEDSKPTFGENGHAISLTDFTLRTEDGLILPSTTIKEKYTPARDGKPSRTELQVKYLDLETLADFAGRTPLPAQHRQLLADFAPAGVLKDFSAQWDGSYPDISAYSVKGGFVGLTLTSRIAQPRNGSGKEAAVSSLPGFTNLTGNVDANEDGGTVELASRRTVLHLPGYFDEPEMPFEKIDMQASWDFGKKGQVQIDLHKLDFTQQALTGSLSGKYLMPLDFKQGKELGSIDLNGRVGQIGLPQVARYLPSQTPEDLKKWLGGALLGGVAKDVRLRLKGELAHFPFQSARGKAKGEFHVTGRIEGGRFDYTAGESVKDARGATRPVWPFIDDIHGSFDFHRARMEIRADKARTSGASLARVKAVVADLVADNPVLQIDGEASGALQNFLRFVEDSPVAGWIDHFTSETKASGNARLELKLQLPLEQLDKSRVDGTLHFTGNTVKLFDMLPPLAGATGKLSFNENGFTLSGIKAGFLGGPVVLNGGSQRDGSMLVKAEGSLTADGIRRAYTMPATQRLTARLHGSTRYGVTVRVKNGLPDVIVESNLAGLGLDFPAPLRKAANENMPLKFEMIGRSSGDAVLRDDVRLSIGQAIAAQYERQRIGDKAEWRVIRGGIGVNAPVPQPESGVLVNLSVKTLNIDEWQSLFNMPQSGNARQAESPPLADYLDPQALAAQAGELIVMGRKLNNVVVGASQQDGVWQANIDSEQVSGHVEWSTRFAGRVTARLAALHIPESAASEVGELLDDRSAVSRFPALDVIAEEFELFGKKLGRLELQAQNARGPAGREWRINKLELSNSDAELKASGKWTSIGGNSLSALNYSMDIANAGKLLDRLGFANVLRGGKGKMEGDVNWKGTPFSLDIPSLSGNIVLELSSGQFLKVDPSAAKLLGVLSLQSLPRRLVLDFRDVFSEGFAFDGVNASATIAQGVVKTDNFKMRGVAATVLIDGTADIANEAQNLHVVVIPEINAGAASVVYGLAVNPLIGVGTFIAQLFLRNPLMKAFTFEYQVTGPWKEPVVTKLQRKGDATPTGESAAPPGTNG